jgi:flagellar hook-length control protein FliK
VLVPNAATTGIAGAIATANSIRGGTPSIVAQAPIVPNLNPNVAVPPDPSVSNPPVVGPSPTVPVSALPAAQLGDRPSTAGERFAALASAGAQLASSAPHSPTAFAGVLEGTQTAGTAPTSAPVALTMVPGARAAAATAPTVSAVSSALRAAALTIGEPALSPVNLGSQALTDAGLIPVRPTAFAVQTRSSDGTPGDGTPGGGTGAAAVAPLVPNQPLTAPSAPAAAAPAPPAVQVADAVISHAQVLTKNGAVEFQMRLDPPELGRIQVQLVSRGDEVHGQVLVASEAVRQVMESQLPELRQRLEAAGVNVQQFSVTTDSGGGNHNPYRDAPARDSLAVFATNPNTSAGASPRARIGPSAGSLDVTV